MSLDEEMKEATVLQETAISQLSEVFPSIRKSYSQNIVPFGNSTSPSIRGSFINMDNKEIIADNHVYTRSKRDSPNTLEKDVTEVISEYPTAINEGPLGLETEGGEEIKGGTTLDKGEGEDKGGTTRGIGGEDSEFIRKYICIYINMHISMHIYGYICKHIHVYV